MFSNLLVLLFVLHEAECSFRVSREKATWDVAYRQCQNFGGRLAIFQNVDDFRDRVKNNMAGYGLDRGSELWVGAKLSIGDWTWEGESGMQYKDDSNSYVNQGCFHQQHWTSGSQLANLTPGVCLDRCQWKGIVGLKKDYCMCEAELVNISLVEYGVCHIPCAGSQAEMCGGLFGVSVYKPAPKMVTWAESEPNPDNSCVMLRKERQGTDPEYVTANCNLQIRALCSFRNDEKCGLFHTCLRWTTLQFTWDDAASACQTLGGHLAEVDNTRQEYFQDLRKFPPGNFWIALRRRSGWTWTNDVPVSTLDFFGHERERIPDHACAVVQNINDNLGLGARSCNEKKYYLCQFGFMGEISRPISDAQKAMDTKRKNMTSLTPIASDVLSSKTTTESINTVSTNSNDNNVSNDDESSDNSMLTTCMYSFLGFISGMLCVLLIGLIVYCVFRCNTPDPRKHQQLNDKQRHNDGSSVSYSSRDGSVQINSPPSDVTYDSVYDQGESPFRRTQRIIRMGSANSWRHTQVAPKRPRTDTLDSGQSDYTWRGMIGGKLEVINTQLRHPESNQSQPQRFRGEAYDLRSDGATKLDAECEVHYVDTDRGSIPNRKSLQEDITTDLDALEGYYESPRCSGTFPNKTRNVDRRSGRGLTETENPTFLQLETKTDEASNEENIYATIKKTFQRIQQEMRNEQEKEDDRTIHTVQLN